MNLLELAEELESLLPDLRHSRETHIQWRDCDQSWRDANPHIGSKEFHADAVADYDRRIEVINKGVRKLRAALPEQPLAEKWRGQERTAAEMQRNEHAGAQRVHAGYRQAKRECADDLDASRDKDRELLRRLVEAVGNIRHHHCAYRDGTGMVVSKEHVHIAWEIADEARKHLGGDYE